MGCRVYYLERHLHPGRHLASTPALLVLLILPKDTCHREMARLGVLHLDAAGHIIIVAQP